MLVLLALRSLRRDCERSTLGAGAGMLWGTKQAQESRQAAQAAQGSMGDNVDSCGRPLMSMAVVATC